MIGQRYHVYENTHAKDPSASFHRIPKDVRRAKWLERGLCEEEVRQVRTRIYSQHFPNGDARKAPSLCLDEPSR